MLTKTPIHLVPLAVIPARNEWFTVGKVVMGVLEHTPCDVLVVDDASSDGTVHMARLAGATVISLVNQLGAWGATQAGIRYAQRNGYQTIVTLDADGQHRPAVISALLAAHRSSGANVLIGTCSERLSKAKRLAARYFRFITGIAVQDFTSGLRVYDRRAIRTLASREASLLDYQDLGVLMLLRKKGLVVKESPTRMSQRLTGGSRVFSSWRMVARYMMHTTVLCFAQISARGRIGRRRAVKAAA